MRRSKNDIRSIMMMAGLMLLLGRSDSLRAQYPTLPSESSGNANYEWRSDLGGWRDKATNLVWGYSVTTIQNYNNNYAGAKISAQNYPQSFQSAAQDRLSRAQSQEDRAALETDPVRRQSRLDLAATFRADAAACNLAGADAARFSNWRVPTLAEFKSAYNKGLFSRGAGTLNFDNAPFSGLQPTTNFHWTSDPPTSRGRLATVFNPFDGSVMQTGVNSSLFTLVVRTGP